MSVLDLLLSKRNQILLRHFSQTSQQGVHELCGFQWEGSGGSVYLEEYIWSDGNRQQDDIDFGDRRREQSSLAATQLLKKRGIKLSSLTSERKINTGRLGLKMTWQEL